MGKKSNLGNQLINQMANALTAPAAHSPSAKTANPYAILLNPNWPEAKWDVSGAFIYDPMLWRLHDYFAGNFHLRLLDSVHGAPACHWNGGRVLNNTMNREETEQALGAYARRGIPVHLTFTNYNIDAKMLADRFGNDLLDQLDKHNPTGRNGVILSEEQLAAHVRARHPRLQRIASIVKIVKENGKGNPDYYRRLASAYDRVMIHPDDNFDLELLAKLEDRDKYEILINEACVRNCRRRQLHYQCLSDRGGDMLDFDLEKQVSDVVKQNDCHNLDDLLFSTHRRTLILSTSELKRIYDLGFRNFKIQGRGMGSPMAMMLELHRRMFSNDRDADHLVFRVLADFLPGVF